MNNLWLFYFNHELAGVAISPSADDLILSVRTSLLGQLPVGKDPPLITAKSWDSAPLADVTRAGLRSIVEANLQAMGFAQQLAAARGRAL